MKRNGSTEIDEKLERQKAILDIIQTVEAGTQEDLVSAMKRRGFRVTQTTISRDLAEMNVIKMGGTYRTLSEAPVTPLERIFSDHALEVKSAGVNLLVLKTRIGTAAPVALELDRAEWKEIVGTIAGDDTIFIAVTGSKENESVLKKLHRLIPGDAS